MDQTPKSEPPMDVSSPSLQRVNPLTLGGLVELNYQLRSRVASEVDRGEALTETLSARLHQWIGRHSERPTTAARSATTARPLSDDIDGATTEPELTFQTSATAAGEE
jgi:hypothetical protein